MGDVDGEMQLPHRPEVVQDLADDLPVGNDDARVVRVDEDGRGQGDHGHVALLFVYLDVLAHAEGLREDDGQPRHEVAEHALHGEAHAETGDADTRDQRRDGEAELVEGDHAGHDHDEKLDDAHEEVPHGRLHLLLLEAPVDEPAQPFRGDESHRENGQRA